MKLEQNRSAAPRAIDHYSKSTESINSHEKSLKSFLLEKIFIVKSHNFKTGNIVLFAKFLRKKLNLCKTPEKNGYGKFRNIEEQR